MSVYAAPGAAFEAVAVGFPTGLAGSIGVRVEDGQGATTVARRTSGVIESPAGSGIYMAVVPAPSTSGQHWIVWDSGSRYAVEEIVVNDVFLGLRA